MEIEPDVLKTFIRDYLKENLIIRIENDKSDRHINCHCELEGEEIYISSVWLPTQDDYDNDY